MLPVGVIRLSRASLLHEVVDTTFEGIPARITSPARTVVDCSRFSQLVGKDAAVEGHCDALCVRISSADEIWHKADASRANPLVVQALNSLSA